MASTSSDWHLVRLLGEGAFGQVRLVASPSGDLLAMKCVGVAQSPDALQLATKEVQFLRALQSCDNVVKLMSCRQTDDFVYIFLEFADGGELFDQIEPDEGMASAAAQHYMRQLLAGLGYMHRRGIAHRDIKPENLLLIRRGCGGKDRLVISDFGFATIFMHNGRRRKTATRCGTLPYVAPEVMSDRPYDPDVADVWSAGVVLVAMLSGLLPWDQAAPKCRDYARWARRHETDYTSVAPWKSIALLNEMLAGDASLRCSVDRASRHPWVTGNLLEQPAKLSRANSNELRTPLAQRNLKRKIDTSDECLSQPVSALQQWPSSGGARDASLSTLPMDELRVSAAESAPLVPSSSGGGRNAFSQPTTVDAALIGTQTQPVTSQTQSADWLVRTYRRMTRFVVDLDPRRALELMTSHLRRAGHLVQAVRGDNNALAVVATDRRRDALHMNARCLPICDGRLLVECSRTRGDGLEFKRMYVRLREHMRPYICTNSADWIQMQSRVDEQNVDSADKGAIQQLVK